MSLLHSGRPSETNKDRALKEIRNNQENSYINLTVPKEFHKKIKSFAVENDITIKDMIMESVEIYMKEKSKQVL